MMFYSDSALNPFNLHDKPPCLQPLDRDEKTVYKNIDESNHA